MALHVEAKTGMLAVTLAQAGAKVRLASCNPLSTDDSVALGAEGGVRHRDLCQEVGERPRSTTTTSTPCWTCDPDFVIDDGADLITMLHTERREQLPHVKGANEETTTGVIRLRAMAKEGEAEVPGHVGQRRPDEVPVRQPLRHGTVHLRRLDERHQPAGGRQEPGRRWLRLVREGAWP